MLTSNSTDVQSVLHVIDRCLVSVDGWDTAIQSRVPVRATVVGKIYEPNFQNGRTPRAINHTYEFAEFRGQFPDYVDPTHLFEVRVNCTHASGIRLVLSSMAGFIWHIYF